MKYGSLCSGIGGMDLGLGWAGLQCHWMVENDPFCRQVLEKNWPTISKYGDIKQLSGSELERVDLIAAGFPCQPTSRAGKKLYKEDKRWIWPEIIRIIRAARPKYILLENPPGLLIRGMGQVLGDLAESGYDAEWNRISAAAVGAWHIRERIFLVAYPASVTRQLQQIFPYRKDPTFIVDDGQQGPLARRQDGAWRSEPRVCRVVDGRANGTHRIRAIGNAVVPQIAHWVGSRIVWVDSLLSELADKVA